MTYWLLVRGRGEKPLDRQVEAARIWTQGSTKRPSVQQGDGGILPQSLWRHSHIRLTEEQFESARELIEAATK